MKIRYLVVALITIFALAACDRSPKSSKGFSLPDGDVKLGQLKFVELSCVDCHSIVGKDEMRQGVEPIMTVPIGGKTTRVVTYGQLVTSVINPSHKISQRHMMSLIQDEGVSKMRNYNSVMTVDDLINLVAFLQDQYELETYSRTSYLEYNR